MKIVSGLAAVLALAALTLAPPPAARAADGKIAVVAAENFYGDIAKQIGGDRVAVSSIMSNPDQDPHLFETTPGTVRAARDAQIVMFNGADYDPWMEKLLKAAPRPGRVEIIAAATSSARKPATIRICGTTPPTMPAVAKRSPPTLTAADPAHKGDYDARLEDFHASLKPLNDKIAAIRKKYAGAAVTASEPVFGYMAQALGLKMRNESFQLSIMNDTEPSAHDVAAFEQDLKDHKVKVDVLQQAGLRQSRATAGRSRPQVQHPGARRDRNRPAGTDLSGLDADAAQ